MKGDLSPRAKDDILRQFRYYLLQDAEDAAFRFLAAVDGSIEMICSMPEIGAPNSFAIPPLPGSGSGPSRISRTCQSRRRLPNSPQTSQAYFAAEEFCKAIVRQEYPRRAYARIVSRFLTWCNERKP